MSIEKIYKVSYKVYHNDRLKPVMFHGKEVHPLYIQVTFDRQPIYFKSYYFDLLSQPQYAIRRFPGRKEPGINEIITKEERLINFLIDKYSSNFSLNLFKERYGYYSRDLLNMMEESFKNYLFIFLNDEGHNFLASMIQLIGKYESGIRIVEGIKPSLKTPLFEKMVNNAAYYAPPYLPLMTLAREKDHSWITTLSVFEWEEEATQNRLNDLVADSFEDYDLSKIRNDIRKLIENKT